MISTDFSPNTDNINRYFLTLGILMFVFSILYPMEKQHEIDLKINEYNKSASLLNIKIKNALSLNRSINQTVFQLNNEMRQIKSKKDKIELKNKIDELIEKSRLNLNSILEENINVEYSKLVVDDLIEQKKEFAIYKKSLRYLGVTFSILGSIFWIIATIKNRNQN
jgi:hypothetical protein